MCTVTYIPDGPESCHLTSNRDEHRGRARALPPRRYGNIVYPKDPDAGGSWIATTQKGDAGVLLNGAFEKHKRAGNYRKSRGLVFVDILHAADPLRGWVESDLQEVEPFTLVLLIQKKLWECRWDGSHRYTRQLDTAKPHIWSSVTLYDEAARSLRQQMLAEWYRRQKVSTDTILDLHRAATIEGDIATASITTVHIDRRKANIQYIDMQDSTGKSTHPLLIRLRHWEYWPFAIVYAPILFYWCWLSLRARSFFFFSTANPAITNAGFLLESKKQIYDLMPEGSYPKTLYCAKGSRIAQLNYRLAALGLDYPLMAKPDIGQRGMGVQLISNECELLFYAAKSKVDFLLQAYIDYPEEAGIFYYRMPGAARGTITGIVGKELLRVTGDGHSTVETLLRQNERYVLQLAALRRSSVQLLSQVPAAGETITVSPYGNHSRGAKFLDQGYRINPELEAVIDDLCKRMPGFYFGRLDIRFASWELLERGESFSVIEVNGAGSEPTHIYDPRHSIFFAWKEIIRHLRILYEVSRANRQKRKLSYMSIRDGLKMLFDYRRHEKLIR